MGNIITDAFGGVLSLFLAVILSLFSVLKFLGLDYSKWLRKLKKDEESSIENGREENYLPRLPNVDSPTPSVDTDSPTKDEEHPMEPVRGLQNLGNTCYFNSTMQALVHTNFAFRDELENLHKKGEFTLNVLKFYRAMQAENSRSYSPDELHWPFGEKSPRFADKKTPYSPNDLHRSFGKKSPKFADYRQHDSHECLRNFLDNIRKEERDNSGAADKRKVLTVVDSAFGGHFITVYICEECDTPYHVCEALLDISLPIMIDEEDLAAMKSAHGSNPAKKSRTVKLQSQVKHHSSQTDDSNKSKLTMSSIDILTQSQSSESDYKSTAVENESEQNPSETEQDSKLDVKLEQNTSDQSSQLKSKNETTDRHLTEIYAQHLASDHEHDVSFAPNEPEAHSIQEEATLETAELHILKDKVDISPANAELENTSDGEIGETFTKKSLAIQKMIDLDPEPGTFSLDDKNENFGKSKRTFEIETNLEEVCKEKESETPEEEDNKEAKIPDKAKESTNVTDSETLGENVVNSCSSTNAESDLAEKNDTANDPSPSEGYSHEPSIPVETEYNKESEDRGWEKSDPRDNPTEIRECNEEQEQSSEDQQHRQRDEQRRGRQHSHYTELVQQQCNTEEREEKDKNEQVQEYEEQDIEQPSQKFDNEDSDKESEGEGQKDDDEYEDRIVLEEEAKEEGEEGNVVEQKTDVENETRKVAEEIKVEKGLENEGQDVEQAQEKDDDEHDDKDEGKKEETEEDDNEEKVDEEGEEGNVVEQQTDVENEERKVAEEIKVEKGLENEGQDVEQAQEKDDDENDDKEEGKKEETEEDDNEEKVEEKGEECIVVEQKTDVENETRKVAEEIKVEKGLENEGQDVEQAQEKDDDEYDDKEEGKKEETEEDDNEEKVDEEGEEGNVVEQQTDVENEERKVAEEVKVEKGLENEGQDVEQAQEKDDDEHDDKEEGKKEETEEDDNEEKVDEEGEEGNVVEQQTDVENEERKVAEEVKVEKGLENEGQDVEQAQEKDDDEHDDKEEGKKEETAEDDNEEKVDEEGEEGNVVEQQTDLENEKRKVAEEVKEEEGQQNEEHEQDVDKSQDKVEGELDIKAEGKKEETEEDDDEVKDEEEVKEKVAEEKREENDKEENLQRREELEEGEFEEEEDAFETSDPYREAVDKLMTPLSLSSPYLTNNERAMKKHITVDDCLMYFTRKEHIHKEYLCNDCYGKHLEKGGTDVLLTSATKQTMIFNPPAILTLHLKRFELKPGGSVKRTDKITYGEFLDIAPYCSSMCLRNDPPCKNIWYSLYGVVVHHGSTLKSGHYTAYVKIKGNDASFKKFLQEKYFDRDLTKEQLIEMMQEKQPGETNKQTGETWYCMNDSWSDKVSVKTVLNQEAYLLFYERMH